MNKILANVCLKILGLHKMYVIAFNTPILDVRGTCVALYDYAHFNETLLKNKSIIVVPQSANAISDSIVVDKFTSRFPIYTYSSLEDLELLMMTHKIDLFYDIKYGKKSGYIPRNVKVGIHCVFDMTEPHGNVYAGVSKSLALKFGSAIYVPHMVSLVPDSTENLRSELGIPPDSIVFGRYGGLDTFNLQFAIDTMIRVVNNCANIYFLLGNSPCYYRHPQIIHIAKFVKNSDKNRFISTCNAHIEFGTLGHSFGLAVAEFSVNKKPVIAYTGQVWNTSHIDILADKGIYFNCPQELYSILTTWTDDKYKDKAINAYSEYTPEKIMVIFKAVFID